MAPADKALLIELVERKDGRLHYVYDSAPRGALVHFVGASVFVNKDVVVTADTSGLPATVASTIEEYRKDQAGGSALGTVVWISKDRKYLASIAYMESVVDEGTIRSYPKERYGILGRKESESDDLLLLSPLWVWYEPAHPNP